MAKLLAIAAIVCAVVAVLTALVLMDAARFLSVAVALAAGILLVLDRRMPLMAGGILVILLAILGALAAAGSISTKGGGGTTLLVPYEWGPAILTTALVLVPAFAAWQAKDSLAAWVLYVGLGAAALAIILSLVTNEKLTDQTEPLVLAVGVLALLTIIPGIFLMRAPATVTHTTQTTHTTHTPAEPAPTQTAPKSAKRKKAKPKA